jgi:hypothetical protein
VHAMYASKQRPPILSDKLLPYLFLPMYVATSYLFISYLYFQIVHHDNIIVINFFQIGQIPFFKRILMETIYVLLERFRYISSVSFLIDNLKTYYCKMYTKSKKIIFFQLLKVSL